MTTYSFYNSASGEFAEGTFDGPDSQVKGNTPPGFIALVGAFDRHTQRVDIDVARQLDELGEEMALLVATGGESGEPFAARATEAADLVTRLVVKREQLAVEQIKFDSEVFAEMTRIERSQLRAVRELLIDPANEEARERLQQIDERIADLRNSVTRKQAESRT